MSKLVVDASVAAKWLVTEPLSDKALDVLGSSEELYAPDLLLAEVGNIGRDHRETRRRDQQERGGFWGRRS